MGWPQANTNKEKENVDKDILVFFALFLEIQKEKRILK